MAKRRKSPTIKDVAERAGVSKSLVSLVMRGAPNVSDERRAAVLAAVEELDYRPNAVARSLVRQRTGVFGVVLSDLHNPFFADVADGIEEGAVGAGYRALFASSFLDLERERIAVDTFLQLRVDGLILLGNLGPLDRFEATAKTVPTVSATSETQWDSMDSVRDDSESGVGLLVDHLVSLGHRRIVCIGAGDAAGALARRSGYDAAMRRHGLAGEIDVVPGAFTEDGGRQAAAALLSRPNPPTAIVAPNDFAALGVLEAADAAGVRVPDNVSVTGYDNLAVARLTRIDLTTVGQPTTEIGMTAVRLLRERIEDDRTEARHVVLAPHLVVGSTTGPPSSSANSPNSTPV